MERQWKFQSFLAKGENRNRCSNQSHRSDDLITASSGLTLDDAAGFPSSGITMNRHNRCRRGGKVATLR